MPSMHALLPTVRSRLSHHTHEHTHATEDDEAETFIKATPKERIDFFQPFIKNKDREGARLFLNTLEAHCYKNGVQSNRKILSEILYVRNYINDKASSIKMLLEHLAVSV